MSTSYGLINSRNEKLEKYRIILSQRTNYYKSDWSTYILTWGLACLPSWLGVVNAGWVGAVRSEIFLQMEFIIFQGYSTKLTAFLPELTTPYNQLLFQSLLPVPEYYFS